MFEVVVKEGTKIFPTQQAADGFVNAVQALLGDQTSIVINEIKPVYDDNKATGKEVGTIQTKIVEYPVKIIEPKEREFTPQ